MKIPYFSHSVCQLIPYPGSKARMAPLLKQLIPSNITTIYSPFMGSAIFEIYLASSSDVQIFAHDRLPHIVNLFQRIQEDKTKVQKLIADMMPCTKEQWNEYTKTLSLDFANLEVWKAAAMTYVIYVYSMSGLVTSRYNDKGQFICNGYTTKSKKDFVYRYKKIHRINIPANIQFAVADYRDVLDIQRTDNAMLYLDPPYDIDDYLYGFDVHSKERFNHIELRDRLNEQSNWILSYGDTDNIRSLYSDYKILEYTTPFSLSGCHSKTTIKELVILSHDIEQYWDRHNILSFN